MHKHVFMLIVCLLLALTIPAWGANENGGTKSGAADNFTVITTPVAPKIYVSPSGYVRDPSKPMAARQYMKKLRERQKEAAAMRAAARAGKVDPQQTKGGAK